MLIQVFIVILWLNPDRFFQTLSTVATNDPSTQSLIGSFFNQWMNDCKLFAGVHDRRVCALGLCTLLRIDAKYYSAISTIIPTILPHCIYTYEGLMKTYQHNDDADSDGSDDDDYSIPSGRRGARRRSSTDVFLSVEIEDGDDETVQHGDDFLEKIKAKVGDEGEDDFDATPFVAGTRSGDVRRGKRCASPPQGRR